MSADQYWKSILKERDDLNLAPSADVTLRVSDIKALVACAFSAGQNHAPPPAKAGAVSMFEQIFGPRY